MVRFIEGVNRSGGRLCAFEFLIELCMLDGLPFGLEDRWIFCLKSIGRVWIRCCGGSFRWVEFLTGWTNQTIIIYLKLSRWASKIILIRFTWDYTIFLSPCCEWCALTLIIHLCRSWVHRCLLVGELRLLPILILYALDLILEIDVLIGEFLRLLMVNWYYDLLPILIYTWFHLTHSDFLSASWVGSLHSLPCMSLSTIFHCKWTLCFITKFYGMPSLSWDTPNLRTTSRINWEFSSFNTLPVLFDLFISYHSDYLLGRWYECNLCLQFYWFKLLTGNSCQTWHGRGHWSDELLWWLSLLIKCILHFLPPFDFFYFHRMMHESLFLVGWLKFFSD